MVFCTDYEKQLVINFNKAYHIVSAFAAENQPAFGEIWVEKCIDKIIGEMYNKHRGSLYKGHL